MRSISVKRDRWLMTGVLLAGLLGSAGQSAPAEPMPEAIRFEVRIERVSSGRRYGIGIANVGENPYVDRQYVLRTLPKSLQGRILVLTSMDDDYADAADHLQLHLPGPATVSVGIDRRGKSAPAWLASWKLLPEELSVDDIPYHVYERRFDTGRVTLGGNERRSTGANSNYVVIVSPGTPVEPFDPGDFARQIRPLLEKRCFECHGPEVQEGGLRLDVRRRAFLGGDSGLAIDLDSSDTSGLIVRITSVDESQRMPLGADALTAGEVALLRHWIDARAPWPAELAGKEDFDDHWSFRPIRRAEVPSVAQTGRVRNPIDAYILAPLEQAAIEPSPEVDRRTLLRRLSLDLLGLPPTLDEIREFVEDQHPDAYERVVDRLLESRYFGERWGKHWLDLARFAESDGYENDVARPHAWRFRDWVIDAVNRDVPFDQFTIEQLAGDLIENAAPRQRAATAFHRNTLHNSAGGADREEFRTKAVKDRAATTGMVWMGLTFNCCECHSHKYDPIAHREYYQFYAFFNNADDASEGDTPTLRAVERTTHVHQRGNFLAPGPRVDPGTPAFLPPLTGRNPRPDRLDLARWLVSSAHPLTARVAVNHVWQHLFGQGLVSTPENFGRKGEPPSHPELLDWLAAEFAGLPGSLEAASFAPWSRKGLIRLIVCSSTYRQSSVHRAEPVTDPENRLLWRQNRVRVEAEIVRDLALSAADVRDPNIGGPSIQPPLPRGLGQLGELKNERFVEANGNPHRRGLYIHMQRTFSFPMLAAFDAPDGNQCMVTRDRSTTPMQALTLLNEPALDECARALGKRLTDLTQDESGRMHAGFEICLGRPPSTAELEVLQELVAQQKQAGASDAAIWRGVARTLLNLDEFITRE